MLFKHLLRMGHGLNHLKDLWHLSLLLAAVEAEHAVQSDLVVAEAARVV
jgi:hypothetical protein